MAKDENVAAIEDIVLMETLAATPRPREIFSGREVFKLQFESGEFDMVVRDLGTRTCKLFEVKHSKERADEQFRHLVDVELVSRTESGAFSSAIHPNIFRARKNRNPIVRGIGNAI